MSSKNVLRLQRAVPQESVPLPPVMPTESVVPKQKSAELGELLINLQQRQISIDRQKAEELARLRALQDRD